MKKLKKVPGTVHKFKLLFNEIIYLTEMQKFRHIFSGTWRIYWCSLCPSPASLRKRTVAAVGADVVAAAVVSVDAALRVGAAPAVVGSPVGPRTVKKATRRRPPLKNHEQPQHHPPDRMLCCDHRWEGWSSSRTLFQFLRHPPPPPPEREKPSFRNFRIISQDART